jgi:hypothetical protein
MLKAWAIRQVWPLIFESPRGRGGQYDTVRREGQNRGGMDSGSESANLGADSRQR